MPGRACCVVGCFNNSTKLQTWNKTVCEIHKPLLHIDCPCLRPYGLHRVPGRAEDQDVRQKWMKHINRDGFKPNKNTVVCGIHFPDGQPTRENPYPVLFMGYECHVLKAWADCSKASWNILSGPYRTYYSPCLAVLVTSVFLVLCVIMN